MPDAQPERWTAAFDALRRVQPQTASDLAARHPLFRAEIVGERTFGPASAAQDRAGLARDAVDAVLASVETSLDEVLMASAQRVRRLAMIRLVAGATALFGAALLGLTPAPAPSLRISAAILTAFATVMNLGLTYVEELSGGDGSVRKIREAMLDQLRLFSEAKGRLTLSALRQDDAEIIAVMGVLTEVSAKVNVARSEMGLRLT